MTHFLSPAVTLAAVRERLRKVWAISHPSVCCFASLSVMSTVSCQLYCAHVTTAPLSGEICSGALRTNGNSIQVSSAQRLTVYGGIQLVLCYKFWGLDDQIGSTQMLLSSVAVITTRASPWLRRRCHDESAPMAVVRGLAYCSRLEAGLYVRSIH